jgi:hypothetical protein
MLATTTAADAMRTTPMMTGRSCWPMASTSVLPSPGGLNTVSTTTTPPISWPMSMPNCVTTGVRALRSACR